MPCGLVAWASRRLALPCWATTLRGLTFATCLAAGVSTMAIANDDEVADEADAAQVEPTDDEAQPDGEQAVADEIIEGHSLHGPAFNEGPRQAARLIPGTGKVNFPVTTATPLAQQFINQGVGQLHGFWYYEAERSFRQAARIDPTCAMAYWGMAMANIENQVRAKGLIAEAVERRDRVTDRERQYIDALNAFYQAGSKKDKDRRRQYVRALESIIQQYPEDIEAKAFLVVTVWQNRVKGWPISSHQPLEAMIQDVLAVEPMHPIHHYRIHLWDDEKAGMALTSAARCGQSAPGIAHMWHMSGHIFSKLLRFHDAIWQQEASSRVDHAYMTDNHVLPDVIHNYAHNQEWMVRNLSNVGRARDAVARAKDLIDLPRHPKYNTLSKGSANWGRMRLFEVLSRYELWDELIELANSPYLAPTDIPAEQVKRLRYLGAAQLQKGDLDAGRDIIEDLEARLKATQAEQDAAGEKAADEERAKDSSEEDIEYAKEDARERFAARIDTLEKSLAELRGHLAAAEGDYDAAIKHFGRAGKSLSKEMLSRVHLAAGNLDRAVAIAKEAMLAGKSQVYPLANYVDILARADRSEDALAELDRLREMAAEMDLDTPVALRLGFTADMRLPFETEADVGDRPPFDTLGPITWQPFAAPAWSAVDSEGLTVTSDDFRGKPTIVVLYLGFGCLHCVEQLEALRPVAPQFADMGVSIVAIGNDTVEELRKAKSVLTAEEAAAFPILSDAEMRSFRSFRAFDDFEDKPLHATLLVDGQGKIRWQDISFEPFTNVEFLLEESQRLLKLEPKSGSPLTAQR